MTGFWIAAAALAAVTLVIMVLPLLRGRGVTLEERSEYDIAVYKDQLKEIDRDLERGLLDDTQADAARVEIQRRMLDAAPDAKSRDGGAPTKRGRDLVLATVLALLCAGSGLGLYMKLGRPGMPDIPYAGRDLHQEEESAQAAEIGKMIEQLAQRMAQKPDDLRGWVLLGRSYESIEAYGKAAEAYKHAVDLSDRNPGAVGAYAEALVMDARDHIPEAAVPLLRELKEKDPVDPRSYFYLAAHEMAVGNQPEALQLWTDLVAISPSDAPWLAEVKQSIQTVSEKAGLDPATLHPTEGLPPPPEPETPVAENPAQGAAPGPTREQIEAASAMTEEERTEMIRGMVDKLAARLEANPDDAAGWERLANAYMVLGEVAKAAKAREMAKKAAGE